jgi:hypothetical protein
MAMDENDLAGRVSDAIESGRIPGARGLKRVVRGVSEGASCVICELIIGTGDIEVQAFFSDPAKSFHFHLRCFYAWDTVQFF